MPIDKCLLTELIKRDFPDSEIELIDLVGDNDHYQLTLKSARFVGLSAIQQHRMVYETLKGYMGNELHALSLKTRPL